MIKAKETKKAGKEAKSTSLLSGGLGRGHLRKGLKAVREQPLKCLGQALSGQRVWGTLWLELRPEIHWGGGGRRLWLLLQVRWEPWEGSELRKRQQSHPPG